MNAAERLRSIVVLSEVWFSLALAFPLAYSVPALLLLEGSLRDQASRALFLAIVLAAVLASLHSWIRTARHRFLLLSLATSSGSIQPSALQDLGKQPARLGRVWVLWHLLILALFATPLRPSAMGLTTGISVALLAGLMVATTSLPLSGVLRSAFLRAIELAPLDVARNMITAAEKTGEGRSRITRRLVLALATPTFFVAFGAALITHAHLRRADERSREVTALALARATLEPGPGILAAAGMQAAIERAQALGFSATLQSVVAPYGVTQGKRGVLELSAPLDRGSALVRFSGSTLGVVGLPALLWSLLAVCVAVLIGTLLGTRLTGDLLAAVNRVRQLGVENVLWPMRRARFVLVEELGRAIQQLTERFAVFAEAQQQAIQARAAAARARGLFFASVSHDLKSPLNAILGFTDLVRDESLTAGQAESLHAIRSRGKELLALIETILDAARVEAAQLSLVYDEIAFSDLYRSALERARELSGDHTPQIWDEIDPNIPHLLCDRVRLSRALASFVAYSVRATQGGKMRLRAEMEDAFHVRIDVDVPGHLHTPKELELMMTESQSPGKRAHRGMALGLRLARSVIELHRGDVRVIDRGPKGAMFCITLGTVEPASRRGSPG